MQAFVDVLEGVEQLTLDAVVVTSVVSYLPPVTRLLESRMHHSDSSSSYRFLQVSGSSKDEVNEYVVDLGSAVNCKWYFPGN
jgi:hypothetical protein